MTDGCDSVVMSFADFFLKATGSAPYDYQVRLAEEGVPEVLCVPTGSGKTAGAVIAWLWRRRCAPSDVRERTPRRLLFVVPMRVLVEQVKQNVQGWLENVGFADIAVVPLLGGAGASDRSWREHPEMDCVLVATQDQALSRALHRGYGMSRFAWPVEFGLVNNDTFWVCDEIQLMGPGVATSRQLAALREQIGTVLPSSTLWMSATVDETSLCTVDNPVLGSTMGLSERDRAGGLGVRLGATRMLREVRLDLAALTPQKAEDAVVDAMVATVTNNHLPATRTLVIVNSVHRAQRLGARLMQRMNASDAGEASAPDIVILHSRFRPKDRKLQLERALDSPGAGGVIVVSTQVLEAGVDLDSRLLVTEAAPWPSLVQRAGRNNRAGVISDAQLWWCPPPNPAPYVAEDVAASVTWLRSHEGDNVGTEELVNAGVATTRPTVAVLRRRDLLALFDTAPDLSGNDVDVGRFIREADDLDVQIGWIELGAGTDPSADQAVPDAEWLCPVPIGAARAVLRETKPKVHLWFYDSLAERWSRVGGDGDLRPGQILLLDAAAGHYDPDHGWDPDSKESVPLSSLVSDVGGLSSRNRTPEGLGEERGAVGQRAWVTLCDHLADTAREAHRLGVSLLGGSPESLALARIVESAAGLHDIGKAHRVFQNYLMELAPEAKRAALEAKGPWAKSDRSRARRNGPRWLFRHELAGALALLDAGGAVLETSTDPALVTYLVAAHHGRVRVGARSHPEEKEGKILGISDGDRLPAVTLPVGELPESVLETKILGLGDWQDTPSWTARVLVLRDRADLGPFRLGFLEALVRIADWRASEKPSRGVLSDAL